MEIVSTRMHRAARHLMDLHGGGKVSTIIQPFTTLRSDGGDAITQVPTDVHTPPVAFEAHTLGSDPIDAGGSRLLNAAHRRVRAVGRCTGLSRPGDPGWRTFTPDHECWEQEELNRGHPHRTGSGAVQSRRRSWRRSVGSCPGSCPAVSG